MYFYLQRYLNDYKQLPVMLKQTSLTISYLFIMMCKQHTLYVCFSYIAENKNLEVINMSMCEGITVNGLMPICNNCTR